MAKFIDSSEISIGGFLIDYDIFVVMLFPKISCGSLVGNGWNFDSGLKVFFEEIAKQLDDQLISLEESKRAETVLDSDFEVKSLLANTKLEVVLETEREHRLMKKIVQIHETDEFRVNDILLDLRVLKKNMLTLKNTEGKIVYQRTS